VACISRFAPAPALAALVAVGIVAHAPPAHADGDLRQPQAVTAAPFYDGYVSLLGGDRRVRTASQGVGWELVFRERSVRRVRYRVCAENLDGDARRCWTRRTRSDGTSRIFVARFINDQGGPGRWRATWSVGNRTVDVWRFRVRPEGV